MKKKLLGLLVGAMVATVLPAGAAMANPNPCEGSAPGPHCRPACFFDVILHEGDPANGEAPWVEIRPSFC